MTLRVALFAACLLASAAHAQESEDALIRIEVAGRPVLAFGPADFANLPRHRVEVEDHGTPAVFEGVLLADVLARAGVALGDSLRGRALRRVLDVEGADGYSVAFALPELEPQFTHHPVLLADRRDGAPLDARHGPWRVVAPGDHRAARWVWQVVRLVVRGG